MVFTWGLLIPFASMNTIIHVPTNIMFPRKQTMTENSIQNLQSDVNFFYINLLHITLLHK